MMRRNVPNLLKQQFEADYLATASNVNAMHYRRLSRSEQLKFLQMHFGANLAETRGDERWAKQVQSLFDMMSRATDA